MDTIAIVGSGDTALVLLQRAVDAGLEVIAVSSRPETLRVALRKRLPAEQRKGIRELARFTDELAAVAECSFVIDCTAGADRSARAQAMRALEDRMTAGAILASASEDLTGLSGCLARPAQFLGMRPVDGLARLVVEPTVETALGVADAAERLGRLLSPAPDITSTGDVRSVASAPPPAE